MPPRSADVRAAYLAAEAPPRPLSMPIENSPEVPKQKSPVLGGWPFIAQRSAWAVYQTPREDAAAVALGAFEAGPRGKKYRGIARSWRSAWDRVVPFFAFSAPIRRAIYTTNAIESLNSTVRRAIRTRGHFPNDRAATKLIYLALRGVESKWRADRRPSGRRPAASSRWSSGTASWWRRRERPRGAGPVRRRSVVPPSGGAAARQARSGYALAVRGARRCRQRSPASVGQGRDTMASIGWPATAQPRVVHTRNY